MKGSAKMIPSNATRALAVAFPSTSALARHRIGILTLLVALPAAVARAQVGEAPPKPVFADNAPVIPHEEPGQGLAPEHDHRFGRAQRRGRVLPRQGDRDASPDGVSGEGVRRPAHEGLEWEVPGDRRGWICGRESQRLERAGTSGLRGSRHRHRPRRGQRELRPGRRRPAGLACRPGQCVPRHPRDDGGGQGVDEGVLRQGPALFLFRGRLDGRPPGIDGGAALPGGLRRHPLRLSGHQLASIPPRGPLAAGGHGRRREFRAEGQARCGHRRRRGVG